MTISQLQAKITTPYFTTLQAQKLFPGENLAQINVQLARMAKRGALIHLKRGVFIFPNVAHDDFMVANVLYPQSYVSLESALNTYSMMPDVPAQVTSITPMTSKTIVTSQGKFIYSKIGKELYFGFTRSPRLAVPEKALLDYVYIRHVQDLQENRISLANINRRLLQKYAQSFPDWVKKVVL